MSIKHRNVLLRGFSGASFSICSRGGHVRDDRQADGMAPTELLPVIVIVIVIFLSARIQ